MTLNSVRNPSGRVSAWPFMLASLVVALVYSAVIVGSADRSKLELGERLRNVPPTAFFVYSAHCAMARRPRRRRAVLFAVLSALAWAVAFEVSQAEIGWAPWHKVLDRLPDTALQYSILGCLVVASNVIYRSCVGPDKQRFTLQTAFVMMTTAAVLLTWISNNQMADFLLPILLHIHIPYLILYGLAAWSVFRSKVPALAILMTLVTGFGFGWACDRMFSARSDGYVILSPGVYVAMLLAALLVLRVADRFARSTR